MGCQNCNNDCNCNSCFEGVKVPVGPKGDQGVPGTQGIQGVQGPQGENGTDGTDGDSAYQIWLDLGNEGTEQDFIDSLTGPQGDQGPQGDVGLTGDEGPQGAPGPAGIQGEAGEDGTDTIFTEGSPANGLGKSGDIAYDITTSYPQVDIYQKDADAWGLKGTFGNVINPGGGGPAEDSYLFRATKVVDSTYTTTADSFLPVEDDSTVPNFDNGGVWNGVKFVADQDLTDTQFTVENMVLDNNTASPVDVDIRIYKNSSGVETEEAISTTAMIASETGTSVTFSGTIASLLENDEVYLKVELSVSSNVTAKDGVFYNIDV